MDNFIWTDELVAEYSLASQKMTLYEFKRSKQQKKEYEVLTMINHKLGVHDYSWQCDLSKETEDCKIHSVKRLSDGAVFSIGDKVQYALSCKNVPIQWVIDNFFILTDHKDILARSKDNINVEFVGTIKKVEDKVPILTTEDGVKMYEHDTIHFIGKDSFTYGIGTMGKYFSDSYKYFSTEQLAKDYVFKNKQCLSLKDVSDWLRISTAHNCINFQPLNDLIKKRING